MGTEQSQQRFGKCVIEREIGRGARSTVYLAWHEGLQIPVAVKVMRSESAGDDELFSERFMREARIAAQLAHSNIVRVYDCGETEDSYYLVLEYIDGQSCRDRMDAVNGAMDWKEVARIVRQVAEGLNHASTKGIIHRDLKPENIMIDSGGNVRIADLGLAKEVAAGRASATADGDVLGTPYYMSPEQVRQPGDVDFRSDIYSLGATLYHMATGVVPFEAPTPFEIMTMHLNEPLAPPQARNADLPEELCDIITRCMAKEPQSRYQSYADLIRDLDAVLHAAEPAETISVMEAIEETLDEDLAAEQAAGQQAAAGQPAERRADASVPESAPPARAAAVRPVELPVTRYDLHARATGLGALLAFLVLTVCLHQVVLAWANEAAAVGATAVLLGLAVAAGRARMRSRSKGRNEDLAEDADQQFSAALTWTCERLDLPTPRVAFTNRRDECCPAYSFFGARSALYVPMRWLEAAQLDEPRMRAFLVQKLAGVYNGDATLRTLLALPLWVIGLGEKVADGLLGGGRLSPKMRLRVSRVAALLGMAAICTPAAVLLSFLPWVGGLAMMAICVLLLVSAFERRAQISADAFAVRVMNSSAPVRSVVIVSGLLSPDRDRMLRESLGEDEAAALPKGLPESADRARVFESIAAFYAAVAHTPDTLDVARGALSCLPPAAERLNRLAKLPGASSRLVAMILAARRAYAGLTGRPGTQPMNSCELARARAYVGAGFIGGALVLVALMFLLLVRGPSYEHFLVATGLVALTVGVLTGREASRQSAPAGLFAWAAIAASLSLGVTLVLGFCLTGRSDLTLQFPAVLFGVAALTVLGQVAYVRVSTRLGVDRGRADRYGDGSRTAQTLMMRGADEAASGKADASSDHADAETVEDAAMAAR